MHNKKIVLSILLMLCLVAAPEGRAAQKEQSKKSDKSAKESYLARWDRVLQGAKAEGSLVVYATANPATKQALTKAMKDKYGIAVDFIIGRGEELVRRIQTETQAGIYLCDLVLAGVPTLTQDLKPTGAMASLDSTLILPEVADPSVWQGKVLPFQDKSHQIIAFVNKSGSHVAVNLDAIKSGELKSYRDLLNPKWKGKIVMDDPTVTGAADQWSQLMLVLFGMDNGRDFLQQITKQDLVILRDKRLVVEWLARNKYPIAVGPDAQTYSEFRANGAPITMLKLREGSASTASGGCLAMLKRAAHPNAALVFINWLLTREGQTIFQKAYGTPSARLDVDMTGMDPAFVPQEGEKLISTTGEEWWAGTTARIELIKQIFKPLIQ